jgi:putative membrane protein
VWASIYAARTDLFSLLAADNVFYRRLGIDGLALGVTPLTILGAAITIFLGFRTNTAYDRWWEARTLWGGDGEPVADPDPAGR